MSNKYGFAMDTAVAYEVILASGNFDAYNATVDFANSGYTDKGGNPFLGIPEPGIPLGIQALVHKGDTADPVIFDAYKKVVPMALPGFGVSYNSTYPGRVPKVLSQEVPGQRHLFHICSSLATRRALDILHSTFYNLISNLLRDVPSLSQAGVAIQPIPTFTTLAGKSSPSTLTGNAFGLDTGGALEQYALYRVQEGKPGR
ncbi:hypothetical protein BDZ91DRAFT_768302 [Kalaharituber pfeilii]|nr:hypothetical protein BDZ91DRAFT_768302 [Kalaharituber pfeilii]